MADGSSSLASGRTRPAIANDDGGPSWQLPEYERPLTSTVVWTRYFVVTMFGILAVWGLSERSPAVQAWLTLLVLAVVGMRSVAALRRHRRLRESRAVAMEALHAGNLVRAGVLLDGVLLAARRFPALHAAVHADRALVDLRLGWFETAKGRLWAALDSGWLADEGDDARLYGLVPLRFGLCEALAGRIEAARPWSARARTALHAEDREHLLALEFVLAARSGEIASASTAVEAAWHDAQRHLPKDELRILGILIAFAREEQGGDPADSAPWFALLAPGEADFLGRHWPDMRAFLHRHRHDGDSPPRLPATAHSEASERAPEAPGQGTHA